jgi:predicted dehydrogenase
MLNAGIVGFGVMGKKHCKCYQTLPGVQVAAICETGDIKKAGAAQAAANLGKLDTEMDLKNVRFYKDFDKMLKEEKLDMVSIALPTFMHADFTIKALQAGVHVLCEKPMALTLDECQCMIDTAEKHGKILQIGHCVRFWPEYVKARQIIDSGEYGRVCAAMFQRLSAFPTWGWNNWQQNGEKNGGAMLDLHIHDVDIILHWFGIPSSVSCAAVQGKSGDYDHIVTQYAYPDDKVITAEASWLMAPGFGFRMSFNIALEKATIIFDSTQEPTLKIYTFDNKIETPAFEKKDGYWFQIDYFVKTIRGENLPQIIITPQQSYDAVRIALAEKISAREHRKIELSEVSQFESHSVSSGAQSQY